MLGFLTTSLGRYYWPVGYHEDTDTLSPGPRGRRWESYGSNRSSWAKAHALHDVALSFPQGLAWEAEFQKASSRWPGGVEGTGKEQYEKIYRGSQGGGASRKLYYLVWMHRGSVSKHGRWDDPSLEVGKWLEKDALGWEGAVSRHGHQVAKRASVPLPH